MGNELDRSNRRLRRRSATTLMRLLPKNSEYAWAMYSVLYFGFFYIDPIVGHASARVWFFTLLATVVFLSCISRCSGLVAGRDCCTLPPWF